MSSSYKIGNRKVCILGAGYVGSSIAYALTLRDIAHEIVLIDRTKEKAEGEAMDIRHGLPIIGTTDLHAGEYKDITDSDLIIITTGRNRKDGETRLDLANDNINIVKETIDNIKKYYTRGVILIITNPVDVITYKATEWMGLPDGMVFGSGCILDTSRLVRLVADYIGLSTGVVNGYIVGEHGESQVPIWSKFTVGGINIDDYCKNMNISWDDNIKNKLADEVRKMGSTIIRAKSRTHYGIASCVCMLADSIINMRPTIVSVTSRLMGEHGVRDVALSVPSVVGVSGVMQRVREKWDLVEYEKFFDAVRKVRKY